MDIDTFLREVESAGGVRNVAPDELEALLGPFQERGLYVSSMEAFELDGDLMRPDISRSMLGLDGEDDWPDDVFVDRMFDLARAKIVSAKESGKPFVFTVWVDDQ